MRAGMELMEIEYEACAPDKTEIRGICGYTSIHFIEGGAGFFNGRRLVRGMGFITAKNEMMDYLPDAQDPWRYIWLRIKNAPDELLAEGLLSPHRTFRWNAAGIADGAEFVASLQKRNKFYRLSGLYMLLSYIEQSTPTPAPSIQHVQDAAEYIRAHYAEIASIQEVAARFCISRAYMRNLFVKEIGVSPQTLLMETRMKRACQLLARTDSPIGTISVSVGYADTLQFSRIFKKRIGISPSEYRRLNRIPIEQNIR